MAAGADIIQSSGYQATVAGFKGLGYGTEEAIELVKLSVRLAVQARNEFVEAKASGALTLRGITLGEETPDGVRYFSEGALPKPLVAASVGPYGAFWRMDLSTVDILMCRLNISKYSIFLG